MTTGTSVRGSKLGLYLWAGAAAVALAGGAESAAAQAPSPEDRAGVNSLATVVYDTYGPPSRTRTRVADGVVGGTAWGRHDALPVGLPSNFDFYEGARPGSFGPAGSGAAVTSWGQIFEAEPGTGTFDARLQVRNHRLYFLMSDGSWVERRAELRHGAIAGGYWSVPFRSNGSASIRDEAANGGGSSASLRALARPANVVLHFWWKGWFPREVIPAGALGVLSTAEMRLIPDTDPGVDLSQARFIGSVGADNYRSATHLSNGTPITAVVQPRMKFLTPQWQAFNGTNLTEAQLRGNPPPLS